ncbi:hypothetical protein [Actinomadura sp. BRA 177]|uniref:hypothetical protein n=1 Tax=Actinomadura sp. BRA 177 TaxID=2745202 RepID=UPI0015963163|nr:hypothetical protein [Actinomadura sp. BRA 177]NVI92693.1 hypothetical protein [Actinomadura sp. BRA 177]
MAEVNDAFDRGHTAGHSGIGPECPVWCLGVRTVGDLVGLLVEAGRLSGLHAAAGVDGGHEHERVTVACPVGCLGLSAHVANALRHGLGRSVRVGDVLGLLHSGRLDEVREMGARRVGEVRTALVAAGFPVPPDMG